MALANRITGVAPLAVIFDAAAPASGTTQPTGGNYNLFDYRWNFGNALSAPGASHSGKSLSKATGPIAAVVFDSSGTYSATCTITKEDGTTETHTQVITVTAQNATYPANQTYYVSNATGSNANDGLSPAAPFQTFDYAMTILLASNGPRRMLFNRGENWTVSTAVATTGKTGPFEIGAYGSGANPILNVTYSTVGPSDTWFNLTADVTDLRILDMNIKGNTSCEIGIELGSYGLLYRNQIDSFVIATQVYGAAKTGVVFAGNDFSNQVNYGVYASSGADLTTLDYLALLNNKFTQAGGNQAHFRSYACRSAVQSNVFGLCNSTMLRVMGLLPPLKTHLVCVTDNSFTADGGTTWVMELGPEGTAEYPRFVENVLVEGNYFRIATPGSAVSRFIECWASKVDVRNNIFDHSGANWGGTIEVDRRGINNPYPTEVRVHNNTVYRSTSAGGTWHFVENNGINSVSVQNNIVRSLITSVNVTTGPGPVVTATNYLLDPLFENESGGNFRLQPTSPCIDTGTTLPVWFDYDWTNRPAGPQLAWDIGAFEYPGGGIAPITGSPEIVVLPEKVDLSGILQIVQGSDYFLGLVLRDIDGTIVDLTAVVVATDIQCEFRTAALPTGVKTGCPVPLVYLDPLRTTGKIWLHLMRNETEQVVGQVLAGRWDMEITLNGYKYRAFEGNWSIDQLQVTTKYSS